MIFNLVYPYFNAQKGLDYSYTGNSELLGNINGNWELFLYNNGELTFNNIYGDIEVMLVGGGAAGTIGAGGGGGEINQFIVSSPQKNNQYSIKIGDGGTAKGEAGKTTSAFSESAQGGKGGTAGQSYITAECGPWGASNGQSDSHIYFYNSIEIEENSSGQIQLENMDSRVNLNFRDLTIYTCTAAGMSISPCYLGTDGRYYCCKIYSTVEKISEGTTGTGGLKTQIFDTGIYVSGPGANESSDEAKRYGQGGNGGSENSFEKGQSGLVVIRNKR